MMHVEIAVSVEDLEATFPSCTVYLGKEWRIIDIMKVPIMTPSLGRSRGTPPTPWLLPSRSSQRQVFNASSLPAGKYIAAARTSLLDSSDPKSVHG